MLTPLERADKVRGAIKGAFQDDAHPSAKWALQWLPPGSLILTPAEVMQLKELLRVDHGKVAYPKLALALLAGEGQM